MSRLFATLGCIAIISALQVARAADGGSVTASTSRDGIDTPKEPTGLLAEIDRRTQEYDSVFPESPLGWLRDRSNKNKKELYDKTGLRLAFANAHVYQAASDARPGEDHSGVATTLDFLGAWEVLDSDKPTKGQFVAHIQGRFDYGTTGPENVGFVSLGSVLGTADTYAQYNPRFLLRNLYWRQGSVEAGWVYQLGKITPDGIVASSEYLSSDTTFLSSGGGGPFAIGVPDSGLGGLVVKHFSDRLALGALVSDANADRFDFGEIDEGDLFKALELHFKVAPQTKDAGYSKITLWHTDGTKDEEPLNAGLGPDGWGYFIKHEQELSSDGRAIGILRYGKSKDDSALYEEQVGVHFIFKEPRLLTRVKNDMFGIAYNWAKTPIANSQSEANLELFYRFPIFPDVDLSLDYQSVWDPVGAPDISQANVYSIRIRSVF